MDLTTPSGFAKLAWCLPKIFDLVIHNGNSLNYMFCSEMVGKNMLHHLHDCWLRTALAVILRGDWANGWLAHFGLKCSSWTMVNSGTSGRSVCCSIGNCEYHSVREGNLLGSRFFVCIIFWIKFGHTWTLVCLKWIGMRFSLRVSSCLGYECWPRVIYLLLLVAIRMLLLMMVAVCLNACIMLEQPYSSFFEYYPRFRDFIAILQKHGGPMAAPWRNNNFLPSSTNHYWQPLQLQIHWRHIESTNPWANETLRDGDGRFGCLTVWLG